MWDRMRLGLGQDDGGVASATAASAEMAQVDVKDVRGVERSSPQIEWDLVAACLHMDQLERTSNLCWIITI